MMAYVSDHAVLRYLERHCGIDIEAVRRRMTVKGIYTAADFGCRTVILGDGARLKLRGCVATTCVGKRHRKPQR